MECMRSSKSDERDDLLGLDTSILNMMSDGVCIIQDDIIVFSNPIASQLFSGVNNIRVEGAKVSDLLIPTTDSQELYKEFLINIQMMDEAFLHCITMIRTYDEKEIDFEFCGKKVTYNNEIALLQIFKLVSKVSPEEPYKKEYEKSKRMLEEAIEYDRIKTEFFENMSHEFRTPLNVIMGIIQLQEHSFKNGDCQNLFESYKKYNEILKQNCYRLVRMINNVLDMTKIEAGYMSLNLKNNNIISTVEDITMSVVDYARSLGVNVIFDTDVEEKIMAFDSDNMERIMLNLLSNAVKFTPEGKNIYVTVKDKQDTLEISIKDEGEGIPIEKQKFIFKRFMQAVGNGRNNRAGTGIGLSLVKSLVEMHGGNIGLSSEKGIGSEFIIKLPVHIIEDKSHGSNYKMESQNNVERVSIEFSDIYNVNIF